MALSALACSPALAQSNVALPGFELERLDTNVGRGGLLLGNGELMKPGGLGVTLLGHYQRLPLLLKDGVSSLEVVQNRATAQLSASYGLLPWLEVSAQVPFVLWQNGASLEGAGFNALSAQGLGTPVFQARMGLLTRRYQQPVDLSADLGVGLPVGTSSALAGDSGPRVHARMTVGTVIGGLHPALEAGVLFRPTIPLTTVGGPTANATAEVRLAAGVSTMGKKLKGELGLRTTLAPQVSMDLLGGARLPLLVGLEAFALAGPSLGNTAVGTPKFRVLLGLTFREEPPPSIVYLEEGANRELQIERDKPVAPIEDDRTRPTQTWELASLSRGDSTDLAPGSAPSKPLPPHQPGAQEQLVLRGSVPFSRGSTALRGVVPLLDQAALRLLEQPGAGVILIEGHADDEGLQGTTDSRTSLQRAQAIRNYLLNQGIPENQVRIRGLGSSWPLSDKPTTEQEHQLNRRVDVLVISPRTRESVTTQAPTP